MKSGKMVFELGCDDDRRFAIFKDIMKLADECISLHVEELPVDTEE